MQTPPHREQEHVSEGDLVRYLDGELSTSERARVAEHLLACRSCAAELDTLRSARDAFGALLGQTPAPTLDAARRAATLAALEREAARPTDVRAVERTGGRRAALRAAAVATLLFGSALAFAPTRGAFANLFNSVADRVENLASPESPRAEQRIRLTGTGIGYVPRGESFVVEVDSQQRRGSLVLGISDSPSVNATAHGGDEIVDLVILPGGMRIANSPEATSDYAVSLPQTLNEVRIRIPGQTERVLTMSELSGSWVSVVDLTGSEESEDAR